MRRDLVLYQLGRVSGICLCAVPEVAVRNRKMGWEVWRNPASRQCGRRTTVHWLKLIFCLNAVRCSGREAVWNLKNGLKNASVCFNVCAFCSLWQRSLLPCLFRGLFSRTAKFQIPLTPRRGDCGEFCFCESFVCLFFLDCLPSDRMRSVNE